MYLSNSLRLVVSDINPLKLARSKATQTLGKARGPSQYIIRSLYQTSKYLWRNQLKSKIY